MKYNILSIIQIDGLFSYVCKLQYKKFDMILRLEIGQQIEFNFFYIIEDQCNRSLQIFQTGNIMKYQLLM